MPDQLIHCIYASAATREFQTKELADLLARARTKNARLSVTGILLYAQGSFLQILEGPSAVVDALFARIEGDERHKYVTKIIREPIDKRSFDEWTMGFYRISQKEIAGLSGVNDFFGKAQSFDGLDAGRAKKVLAAFREGSWRRKLSGAASTASV